MLFLNQKAGDDVIHLLKNKICIHNIDIVLPQNLQYNAMKKVFGFSAEMNVLNQSAEFYATNRGTTKEKAANNTELGKYGELAAYYFLHSVKFPKVPLDFDKRIGVKKGWFCDLPFSKQDSKYPNCHIKTCNTNTVRYAHDYSWTFQWANLRGKPGGKDILFSNPLSNELIIFMHVENLELGKSKLIATAPWFLCQDIFEEPVNPNLKGLKKCIYYKDLLSRSKFNV